jgi:hypothetical protein
VNDAPATAREDSENKDNRRQKYKKELSLIEAVEMSE